MRRITTPPAVSEDRLVYAFTYADSDHFTQDFFHEPLFGSVEEARTTWAKVRHKVWAQTYRMDVPHAARVFDGLTASGWQYIWDHYADDRPFSATTALRAIDGDRAAIEAFVRRDARGAAPIAIFLAQWRVDLDTLAQIAEELGAWDGPLWRRPIPCGRMSSARRYGDGGEDA